MTHIEHVLIANRGEIAARVIRTCQRLGIRTTAVYSAADVNEPHVRMADSAVHLGPAPASQSYLVIEHLVRAAVESGCDAVHPGYGFLSENAEFADAVTEAGLTFIGPSVEAIRLMGDKAAAKRLLSAHGVPVVPGVTDDRLADAGLREAALGVGFPLLIKAVAGGGGKGIRTVQTDAELDGAIAASRREADAAFGDSRLIVEKLVTAPRHIEFQVFGDRFGSAIHLLERECSIQRRHQKVVEECPSPAMTDELRARMGAAAVAAAKAVSYEGAGTVEFLVAGDTLDSREPDFFFLEMNTRLQVEHPVTEEVLGLDLVELQLIVASGRPLPLSQDEVTPHGHAIEVRLYAEDPIKMLPQFGEVLGISVPQAPAVRADLGVSVGSQVGRFYDPMLGKLIVHGLDRRSACELMESALRTFVLHGVMTNQNLLLQIVRDPMFRSGHFTTAFLDERFQNVAANPAGAMAVTAAMLAIEGRPNNLWSGAGPYRPTGIGGWSCEVSDETATSHVTVSGVHDHRSIHIDGNYVKVTEIHASRAGIISFLADGIRTAAQVTASTEDGRQVVWVHVDGMTHKLIIQLIARAASGVSEIGANQFGAPMPGVVTQVNATVGEFVAAGMTIVVIEAMKMEHPVVTQEFGVVTDIHVRVGQSVKAGLKLVTFAATDAMTDDIEVNNDSP